jgi:hypothetical protein
MKQKKKMIRLPTEVFDKFKSVTDVDERNEYIKALRAEGWTLQSIADTCGTSRERIRQIVVEKVESGIELDAGFLVPEPPRFEAKAPRVFIEPSADTLQRLLELQPMAQQVRSNASRFRKEAEEYTRLLNHARVAEGVTLYRLAKRLGVTHSALRFRLARYGYMPQAKGNSRVYKPIEAKNRILF